MNEWQGEGVGVSNEIEHKEGNCEYIFKRFAIGKKIVGGLGFRQVKDNRIQFYVHAMKFGLKSWMKSSSLISL